MLVRDSSISEDVARERGYRTISDPNELTGLGFAYSQCRPGLLIPIRTVGGEIGGYQLRPDHPRTGSDGKTIKYETPAGWKLRLDIPARVGPHLRDPKVSLWITEGAKKVDALISQEVNAIGVIGVWGWRGTNETGGKTTLSDWSEIALNSRDIVLCFDNDLFAKPQVRRALDGFRDWLVTKRANVRFAVWGDGEDGQPKGIDDLITAGRYNDVRLLDHLPAGPSPDEVPDWEVPQPLEEDSLPDFPLDALPPNMQTFAQALSIATETDLALPAVVCLGTIGTAARNTYVIEVEPGYTEPTNLYVAAFLASGNRKSQVFRDATQPVVDFEREKANRDKRAFARWEAENRIEKAKQTRLEKDAANAEGGKAAELTVLAQANAETLAADRPPVVTKLITDDVTPEKLASLLAEQRGFISVMSPEGGSIFGNVSRYNNGGIPNLDTLLKGHANDDIRVDRSTRDPEFVPRARVNMVISPQPRIAMELGRIPGFRERGGAARMLACFPVSRVGYRTLRTVPVPDEVRASWGDLITAILELDPEREADADGHRVPCAIRVSPEAWDVWKAFHHEIEALMRPEQPLHSMQDWGNKCHGAAARIAGLLHLARHAHLGKPETVAIDAETMLDAIAITRYFAAHAQVFYDQFMRSGELLRARSLWDVLESMPASTTKQALFQRVRDRRAFQTADSLDAPLSMLSDLGYIRLYKQHPVGGNGPGGRPSVRIETNPLARTQNPQNAKYLPADDGSEGFRGIVQAPEVLNSPAPVGSESDIEEGAA